MKVYHECKDGVAWDSRGPAMTLTPATTKRITYSPPIDDLLKPTAHEGMVEAINVRFWQPYHCPTCGFTAYELVGE